MTMPRLQRDWQWLVPLGVIMGLFAVLALRYAWSDLRFLLSGVRVSDDAFYYFQVARNLALGYGPTFDTLNPTNGFQPLWLMLIFPAFAAFPASVELPIHIVLTFQVLVAAGAMMFLYRVVSRGIGTLAGLAILLSFFRDYSISNLISGMETPLVVFCLSWIGFLWVCTDEPADSEKSRILPNSLKLGLALGTCILARLDTAFLVFAVFGLLIVTARISQTRRFSLGISLVTAIIVTLPYFFWNVYSFGHLAPISGFIKTSFPQSVLLERIASGAYKSIFWENWLLIVGLALFFLIMLLLTRSKPLLRLGVMLIIGWFLWHTDRMLLIATAFGVVAGLRYGSLPPVRFDRIHQLIVLLTVFGTLLMGFEFAFMRWGIMYWHYSWIELMLAPLLAVDIGLVVGQCGKMILDTRFHKYHKLLSNSRLGHLPVQTAGIIILLLIATRGYLTTLSVHSETKQAVIANQYLPNWQIISLDAAMWVRANLPSDAVFGMSDAGVFGYFSGRKVINLDGVINSFDFQHAVSEGRGVKWLENEGTRYFVFHAVVVEDDYSVYSYEIPSRKLGNSGGQLELSHSQEIYRSQQYNDMGRTVRLIIWQLKTSEG